MNQRQRTIVEGGGSDCRWRRFGVRSAYALTAAVVVLIIGTSAGICIPAAQAAAPRVEDASSAGVAPAASASGVDDPAKEPILAGDSNAKTVGPDPGKGMARLPGHVLDALSRATVSDAPGTDPASLTLTVLLTRDDQAGFESYLNDVYDAQSQNFRHFLSQAQIAQKFGPSKQHYNEMSSYLKRQGFHLVAGSRNRMTLTVRAPRKVVERTFRLDIRNYSVGGATFFANDADPALPQALLAHVQNISGFTDFAKPTHAARAIVEAACAFLHYLIDPLELYGMGASFAAASTAEQAALLAGITPEAPEIAIALGVIGGSTVVCFFFDDYFEFAGHYPAPPGSGFFGGQVWNYPPVKGFKSALGLSAANAASASAPSSLKNTPRVQASTTRSSSSAATRTYVDGTGQTIGLLEFDTYHNSDVSDFINLISSIGGNPGSISNLSEVPVNGGIASPGADESEVLLDINTVMSVAPGAKVVVYDAPFNGQPTSYTAMFNAMINGGVNIISNSWASCEDQMSLAEVQGIDTVLQTAAASGITVVNGTGDGGSTCLDGSPNVVSVPADSPSATAVGGTSFTFGSGLTYGSETWWDGSTESPATGQGGFGVSKFFSRPSYQASVNSGAMRSIPDVVAPADPSTSGMTFCQADNGGCPSGLRWGGTSMSAPTWAGFAAMLNEAQGKELGALNPLLYPLAGSDAFHTSTSMGSDFSHVGLGSPNLNVMNRMLLGTALGTPAAGASQIAALFNPTTLVASANGVGAPADGTTAGSVVVILADDNGNTVKGKTVSLTTTSSTAIVSPATVTSGSDGSAVFTMTDATPEAVVVTATDTTDGVVLPQVTLGFGVPRATAAGITANPSTVAADGTSTATLAVTLKDTLGRPTPGKTVSVTDGTSHAVLTGPTPSVTDVNGQIQFGVTDQVAETVTFSAVDVTDGNLPFPNTTTVTYSNATNTACGVGTVATAGSGYTVTPFITGLPAAATIFYGNANIGCPGGNNPAFTSSGHVLTSDFLNGGIYQTGVAGGAVSTTNLLSTLTPALGPLVYGKDGNVYATLGNEGAQIVQVDPTTGAQLRVVASGLTCPAGLATDPLSGDLFFDDQCTGGGTDNASIFRVIDPANSNSANPTSVVVYATLPLTPNGGLAFAPNGTLYAVSGYYGSQTALIEQISGTNSSTVAVTTVSGITSSYSLAVGTANSDGSAQSLIVVSTAGVMTEVPIANPSSATVLVSANSPGAGVIGPDGCLYSAGYDTIYKIANATGGCSFAATSPAPSIKLTPTAVSPNPAQGSAVTLTATLENVGTPAGVPVSFYIAGANSLVRLVDATSSGSAVLSYTGAQTGTDSITAVATVNGTSLKSNAVPVTWISGRHVTFLSLNSSPQGGTINQPVTIVASLSDVSASPTAGIAGQSVTLTLGSASCTATTNSAGIASCALTPSQGGTSTLTAQFAGGSTLAASTMSASFNVSFGQVAAPTVTLAVSPTTIATGASATLAWSSTNATACTASGAWSGSQATSGSSTVTPASTGSFSYTLTCLGNGGTAAATAVLSATLVAVTVNAKSGGGAMTWPLLLALGLLVALRWRPVMRLFPRLLLWGVGFLVASGIGPAHADDWSDPLYAGIRVGAMPVRLDSGKLDQGLATLGYGEVTAQTDTSGTAGTVFVGYEFTPYAGLELSYTYRDANTAQLRGNIASTANLTPLLQDTTELLRSYGNIVALSYSGHFTVAPRFTLEPRLGGFFWATKETAVGFDDRIDATHEGGGITAGVTAAYRLWCGLEVGVSVDHYRGFPNNIATMYGGSLEWRFGSR